MDEEGEAVVLVLGREFDAEPTSSEKAEAGDTEVEDIEEEEFLQQEFANFVLDPLAVTNQQVDITPQPQEVDVEGMLTEVVSLGQLTVEQLPSERNTTTVALVELGVVVNDSCSC